ncbi:MAG: class I SAM-dependent methyltransferase [Lachnospiraceae bacterium]|nr:class I SAM-dependent methyltransferase [Lachnospiraceae bacterium]
MNNINKTLYIPLYGKAYVSKKGIILHDSKAESIWDKEGFELKGKSKSKWLAYNMGMRSAVFDKLVKKEINETSDCTVLHIGCGMDSRAERIGASDIRWYDIDFPDVIAERQKYYKETGFYRMIAADARQVHWLKNLPTRKAIVILEGISMYFTPEEMKTLLKALTDHFAAVTIFMDCYTVRAAKASKYKNPINDVGVTTVYGIDDPCTFEDRTNLSYVREHNMTPPEMIQELKGMERFFFKTVFGGKLAKKIYRMYEYRK